MTRASPDGRQMWPIWLFGLGYFAFYLPYGALTKATTQGLATGHSVSGFVVLPISVVTTAVALLIFVTAKGWWRHLEPRTVFGLRLRLPRSPVLISGCATAAIIGTTTLAYSFVGVSLVFMMVLMRGGVLLIARGTDTMVERRVHPESTVALVLTMAALAVLFAETGGHDMTLVAAVNVAIYLGAYFVRFQIMHRVSKTDDRDDTVRYLVEELAVAMPLLVAGVAAFAFVGGNEMMLDLRVGFTALWTDEIGLFAMLIGLCYAALYICGTLIYTYPREFTYCVPINRASSILSGVAATYGLVYLFDYPRPSAYQLMAAGLLMAALLVLAWAAHRRDAHGAAGLSPRGQLVRKLLFICDGNRLRSPMAQALCESELAAHLGVSRAQLSRCGIEVRSAGLSARNGAQANPHLSACLKRLGEDPLTHTSERVTADTLRWADRIYCMTQAQQRALIALAPEGCDRIHRLDDRADLEEPEAQLDAIVVFALRIRELLRAHIIAPDLVLSLPSESSP